MDTPKEEILEEIRDANPLWLEALVKYAYELMPTTYSYAFAEGTSERSFADQWYESAYATWARSIGLLPEDAEIPPMPVGNIAMARSYRRPTAQANAGPVEPVVYAPPVFLTAGAKNGVWPPKAGSVNELIWQTCDKLRTSFERVPQQQEVLEALTSADAKGLLPTEYARWIKYNG